MKIAYYYLWNGRCINRLNLFAQKQPQNDAAQRHWPIIIDTMLARTPNILAGDFGLSVVGMSPGIAKKETFAAKSTVAWHVLSRMRYASFRE